MKVRLNDGPACGREVEASPKFKLSVPIYVPGRGGGNIDGHWVSHAYEAIYSPSGRIAWDGVPIWDYQPD